MAAFGEGSGTENNASLGFEAVAGQDNFVYVRCRNRGAAGATNVAAQVFWSPVSTLVTPDLWTPVGAGSVAIPDVPIGEILTVSQALTWPAAEIPATGHYCFVGILASDGDPAPSPAAFGNFDAFRNFIRNNNNVTWRNFNVIPADPSDPEAQVVLPWIMPGAPDRRAEFALDLTLRLPKNAEVLWTLPISFLHGFEAQLQLVDIDKKAQRATAKLPGAARLLFGPALVSAKARYDMSFAVRLMSADKSAVYRIEARQLFEGKEEVGRITWLFDPKAGQQLKAALAEGPARRPTRRRPGT